MATINTHKAKDGTLTYRVRVRRRGERVQTASFPTLKDARKWVTMMEGDIIAGRHFPDKKPKHTLNELLDRYVQEIMPRKTPETQRSHRAVVAFWQERLGHKLLTDITKADVIALRDELGKTSAPATVQKYLTILSHALNTAIREYGWIDHNVVTMVSRPLLPQGRVRYLTDDERTRLLQECKKSQNPYLYALVILALATGLRRGSLLGLTTDRVDVSKGIIYLEKTKNGSRLALPLVGEALILVRNLCAETDNGYLFPRGQGNPWCHYRAAWDHAVQRARLEDSFHFHDLRHTACSYMVQAGVPLYTVGTILNHKNPAQMTARYAHLSVDNLREALETLSTRLSV